MNEIGRKIADKLIELHGSSDFTICFLPYKRSMWDCMRSVYEECIASGAETHLLPLPYYRMKINKEVDYIDYDDFGKDAEPIENLEKLYPDYVVIHYQYNGNNKVTQEILDNLRGSRIFGFTATPIGRSDKSDLLVEALFGQPIVNYSYKQAEEVGNVTPILVQMWDVPGKVESSRSPYGNAMTQNKRRFYWNNEPRNRLIQALARLVPSDEQVLIMTDTVEHLVRLGALLPEFALICGFGHDLQKEAKLMRLKLENRLGDSKEEYARITEEFKRGSLRKVIATFCWKQAVDFPQLSVLIRADGAKSVILGAQIPGRMSRLSAGKDTGLLIDFTDGFNMSAKRKAEYRERSYRKTGWKIEHMGSLEENP